MAHFFHCWSRAWLCSPFGLAIAWGLTGPALAEPAAPFQPHLAEIFQVQPPDVQVRLPSQVFLSADPDRPEANPADYTVKVFASQTLHILTLSLSTCQTGIVSCLVGTITLEPTHSSNAQRAWQRHQAGFAPITLAPQVQGYVLDGRHHRPPLPFSSLMWQQDHSFYTLTFPVNDRQNLLFTAQSMAQSEVLTP